MTTFGLRPDDVVTDTKGNVLDGAAVKLYATQDDASNQINLLGTAYTDPKGRWTFSTDLALVWARTANGLIWRVDSDEEDHGQLAGLLDDDHPQYALADGTRGAFLTQAQADTLYDPLGGGGGGGTVDATTVMPVVINNTDPAHGIQFENPTDKSSWTLYSDIPGFYGTWDTFTNYMIHDVVIYNDVLYKSLTGYVAGATVNQGNQPDISPTQWEVIPFSPAGGASGSYPDATGQAAAKVPVTDGADGWTFENKVTGDATITKVVALTQTAYDALTPDATTLYVINGA